jgi:hypothetical protein
MPLAYLLHCTDRVCSICLGSAGLAPLRSCYWKCKYANVVAAVFTVNNVNR